MKRKRKNANSRRNSIIKNLIIIGIFCVFANQPALGLFLILLGLILKAIPKNGNEKKSFREMQIEGHMVVIDDCAKLLDKTTNIETYFSRYNLLIERIEILEQDIADFPEIQQTFEDGIKMIQDDHENDINRFIHRAYDKAIERREKLSDFFGQFERYKNRLYYSNCSLLMELCRKSGLQRSDCYQRVIDLSHYVANHRRIESFKDCGITEYTFHCLLDVKTCPICGNLDGKSFSVQDAKEGVNLPPLHSGCRCIVGPRYTPMELLVFKRNAETAPKIEKQIPANITWLQWRDMFSVDSW